MRSSARGLLVRLRRADRKFAPTGLLATIALFAASTVSTHAQSTDWVGQFSSDWFFGDNWDAGIPRRTIDVNINTVTPNATVVGSPGAEANNLSVGANGTGTLTIQNGGTLTNEFGTIGDLPGGVGTVIVTGAGSSWKNVDAIVVGGLGTGTLIIQNGGSAQDGSMASSTGGSIGQSAGSMGTVVVTGPGSSWINGPSGGFNIGSFGTGTLTIANGGSVIDITPLVSNIGNFAGSRGTVTVTGAGSLWSDFAGIKIGNSGTGTLTIADGGIVAGPIVTIAANAGSTGTLNIGAGAGNPAAAPGRLTVVPNIAFGAGTGTINFNHTSASYVFAPAIIGTSGTGTVNVLAGTTTLTGANTYSGATNVSAGTLRAGALNRFSPNSAVTVASGGTLDLNGFSQTVPSVINAGLVNMGTGTAPGTVLTTTNYTGTGGRIGMNTFLAGDGSPSDLLRINGGTASGTTGVIVRNAGGGGALTTGNGILVVDDVTGQTTTPGAFHLAAPAVAGPYEYLLVRGGTGAGASDDWFLRSGLRPVPPEPGPGPGPGPGPSPEPPVVPDFRQEVSLYDALPVMAAIYGRKMIDTLHERMGGNAQLLGPDKPDSPDGMWGRIIGYWGHRDGDPVGIFGRDGPAFDYDFGAIQSGLDLYRNEYTNGQRDNAGLYFALGRASADVEHTILGRTFNGGKDKFDAVSVGGYWTRFGENNWYLDGVLQGTWYEDIDMTARRGLQDGKTNGFGFAASLEGGYPFQLGGGWLLEPQAQLVYQALNINDFNDGAADVRYSGTDSLAGRIGARVARDWDVGDEASKRKVTLWGRADLWNEFLSDPTTEFSSAAGFVPFTADLGDSWATLGIGAETQISDATSVYGNVNYDTSFNGNADAWEGKVGLKVKW